MKKSDALKIVKDMREDLQFDGVYLYEDVLQRILELENLIGKIMEL